MALHNLDAVRAARENMLMRFSKVTPEGKYIPPPPANSKASFSTMTYVRATIVEDAGEYLARAVTIAVRLFCNVRRMPPCTGHQLPDPCLTQIDKRTFNLLMSAPHGFQINVRSDL